MGFQHHTLFRTLLEKKSPLIFNQSVVLQGLTETWKLSHTLRLLSKCDRYIYTFLFLDGSSNRLCAWRVCAPSPPHAPDCLCAVGQHDVLAGRQPGPHARLGRSVHLALSQVTYVAGKPQKNFFSFVLVLKNKETNCVLHQIVPLKGQTFSSPIAKKH